MKAETNIRYLVINEITNRKLFGPTRSKKLAFKKCEEMSDRWRKTHTSLTKKAWRHADHPIFVYREYTDSVTKIRYGEALN